MNRSLKRMVLVIFDILCIIFSFTLTYVFLDTLLTIIPRVFLSNLIMVIVLYVALGLYIKIFDKINQFTGIRETIIHSILVTMSYVFTGVFYSLFNESISFRHLALSYLLSVVIIPASRVAWRIYMEHQLKVQNNVKNPTDKQPIRSLIVGAGTAGAIFARSIRLRSDINVIGFLDDDINKQGTTLYGHPVIGRVEDLESAVKQYQIEQVTIAIPSLSNEQMKKIVTEARKTNVKTNQMPYIEEILSGDYKLDEFKEIEITDLLGRDEVELDTQAIGKQIAGRTVLISGAGGSIGSEVCRQVTRYSPKQLILLGHGEFSIYKIERELRQLPNRTFDIIPVIADIQDRSRLFEVMEKYQPDLVYHAAAHKHVPLMEANPIEAVKNNILGTKNLAEAAKEVGVESFVMISTDKAVNPPNVMGATKRIAEMIVTGLNEEGKTNFAAVRFGNVLGSSGSVVPVFKEQIEKGGPLTVTDLRMTRYFMTIPEASRLVLQAGALASGGEIFVLDMGEPVKIVDLAKQMIWLSGYSEEEIEIVESGIRPGEKLYEELLATDENTIGQIYEKIFVGKVHNLPLEQVEVFIKTLLDLSEEKLKENLVTFANNTYEENMDLLEQLV